MKYKFNAPVNETLNEIIDYILDTNSLEYTH